nr:hypothetical protein [Tanacetum cinerariifolium]
MEEPSHSVFKTSAEDQPIIQTTQHPEWFSQPRRPPTPDRNWNKTLPAAQRNAQSWISALAKKTDARSSFNELLDTPIDFSNFIMNRLGVDTLTPELLAGPTYELMRGSCQQYPHNLLQPLPLIPNNRGRRVIPKRRRDDDADKDEEPSAGPDRGSKRRRERIEPKSASAPTETATRSTGRLTQGSQSRQESASESAFAEEPMQTIFQMEEPSHPDEDERMMIRKDPPLDQTEGLKDKEKEGSMHQLALHLNQLPGVQADLLQGPNLDSCLPLRRPPTPDRDWNKSVTTAQGDAQSWISTLAKQTDARSSFNELLDTPIDFSNFIMNRLGVDKLTPELLAGPTYELMRGSCNSLTELKYHLEEFYKATTDQLDRVNPEGQQYPHNLLQPLPLIPDNWGRSVIPFEHFINNDLKYLRGGASSRKYTTYVTKTTVADYGHIKWIEDLVPRAMWIQEPISYDKHAFWGVSHWGRKHQQFYGFTVNRESALDVYFKRRIIALGVESYQKRLNLTRPDTYRSDLKRREAYTAYSNPRGFIYQNKDKKNRLMRIDELYKFSDGTLNDVRNALYDRLKGIQMQYLLTTIWRRGDKARAAAMIQAIDKMLKTRRIMRSLERFVGGRQYEGDFQILQRTI